MKAGLMWSGRMPITFRNVPRYLASGRGYGDGAGYIAFFGDAEHDTEPAGCRLSRDSDIPPVRGNHRFGYPFL